MLDEEFQHNFHTHTFRCKHAKGETTDYCAYAVEHGMKTLGFSDHTAIPDDRWISVRMAFTELDDYVEAVQDAKQKFPELRVVLGMECEYVEQFHSFYEDELYDKHGFEYLVGGPHYFRNSRGDWQSPYDGAMNGKELSHYAKSVVQMIESGLFDFIAHPDLFGVAYRHWDENTNGCAKDIISAAAENGVGLEINALGCRKQARKKFSNRFPLYPWKPFWELASEYDVKTIVNADAHRPTDLQRMTGDAQRIQQEFGLHAMDPETIGTARQKQDLAN